MTSGNVQLAVDAKSLSKSYFVQVRRGGFLGGLRTLISQEKREVKAVKDVSFAIRPGEFVGYIGPNGAGKSTTVKMLTGILHPTSGKVLVDGLSPQHDRQRVAREIGVVFGQRTQLWWDLPTVDSFEILSAMYDVSEADYRIFLKEFDDLLGIGEFLDMPVRRLSLGQRMRAELAAALIHRPKILFLDEPTIGLDVVAKGRMREFLARLNADRGVTILLTTHDLRDIEELCDRVMMINHGSLLYDGTLDALRSKAGLPTLLSVKYAQVPPALAEGKYIGPDGAVLGAPHNGAWRVTGVNSDSRTVDVHFDRSQTAAPTVIVAMQALGEIRDVSIAEPPIEDIIKRLLEQPA
ncbi:MAG: ABC transporter ATP-binding protein [Bacillota bacterium]